jgi:hypothetical protein
MCIGLSIALASLSFIVQRYGPETGICGNVCGPNQNEWCVCPLLNAGFPLGYVFDIPATSVRNQLVPFIEDEFRLVPFIIDVLFYVVAVYALSAAIKRSRFSQRNSL